MTTEHHANDEGGCVLNEGENCLNTVEKLWKTMVSRGNNET